MLETRTRLEYLDALRGALAVIVLFVHAGLINGTVAGGLAVDLFFILSGFVVAYRFQREVTDGIATFTTLMKSRFLRLYPLHIVTFLYMLLLICIAYAVQAGSHYFSHAFDWHFDRFILKIATNLALLNGIGLTAPLTFNGPAWSISVEFVVAPLLFVLMKRPQCIKYVMIVIFLMSVLLVFSLDNHDDHYPNLLYLFNIGLMRGIIGISLGFLMYKFYELRIFGGFFISRAGTIFLIASGVFCSTVAFFPKASLLPDVDILVLLLSGPFLILGLSYRDRPPRVLAWLGAISFSIYMWQIPVITTLGLVLDRPPPPPDFRRISYPYSDCQLSFLRTTLGYTV